jgi:hypothetical protein
MTGHTFQRNATAEEQARLQGLLDQAPSTARRWRLGAESALVGWAASLLGIVVVWLGTAWLARKLLGVDYGLHSATALWVVGIAAPLCAALAVRGSVRWVKRGQDRRPALRADLAAAQVVEEHLVFDAAKRFQEQEHGGLLYLLRTVEGRVFTLHDPESQELGMQDGDPLASGFRPMSRLAMVRAPQSGFVISQTFSGEPLSLGEPIVLDVGPEQWPESEAYCSIPWAELETVLGPRILGQA